MPPNLRSVVETTQFSTTLKQLRLTHRESDTILEGVLFVVARNPREGIRIAPGSHVWAISFESPISRSDSFILYYTFDAQHVFLLALQQTTSD
jgi:hypothetical protein